MKILSIINISNLENIGSDSGVIFHRTLFTECVKLGYEIVIASPVDLNIANTKHIKHEVGKSKYDVRFRFDWDRNKELLLKIRPDVLICHQIELTSHYRALLTTTGLNHIKLLSYYHYLPMMEIKGDEIIWDPSLNHNGLAEIIFFNIISAIKTADVLFVTSMYSRKMLIDCCAKYHITIPQEKIVVMPPPADPFFLLDKPMLTQCLNSNTVLYNSRLYEQYGTDFLIEIIEHFKNTNVKFMVTDFFQNKNGERKKLDIKTEWYRNYLKEHPNVVVRYDGDIRHVYRDEIIANSTVVFGPYRKNANWSMGMIDAFMMGVPGIAPRFASFVEFVPDSLLYDTKKEAIFLLEKILQDDKFRLNTIDQCKEIYSKFLPEKIAKIFFLVVKKL